MPPFLRSPVGLPILAFVLTVLFVPFRHRTLVSGPDGSFAFVEQTVWAPLWNQPTFSSGVAEYPFRTLLVEWALLAVGTALWVAWSRRSAGREGPS